MAVFKEVREFDLITSNPDFNMREGYTYVPEDVFKCLVDFLHEFSGSGDQADAIDFLKCYTKKNVGDVISAQNYVGLIQTKHGHQIQVLPKIDFSTSENASQISHDTKSIFLKMLRSMKDFPGKVFNAAGMSVDRMNLYELFINMYLQEVRQLLKYGLKSDYLNHEENSKLRPYLKKVIVADENGISTPEMVAIDFFCGIEARYVMYCLTNTNIDRMINIRSYGVKMPRIDASFMVNLPIPIPPVEEQARIVEKVEKILAQIQIIDDLQTQYQSNVEVLKKKIIDAGIRGQLTEQLPEDGDAETLYSQIFKEKEKLIQTGKIKMESSLNPISDEEIPFDVPFNWRWVRIGDVSYISGTGLVRSANQQYEKADYYYFKMNNIGNFTGKCNFDNMPMVYASDEEVTKYTVNDGDFLFNTRNSLELVGKCAVIQGLPYKNVLYNNNLVKIVFDQVIDVEFVEYFFISTYGRLALRSFVSSTTNVAAIYQRQITTMIIPLPPLAEQRRIVKRIDGLMEFVGL